MENKTYTSNRRRVRTNVHIRELAATVQLSHKEFIQPLFVEEGLVAQTPIQSLNEMNTDTIESLLLQIHTDILNGITKFLIFPVPSAKSEIKFDFSFVIKTILAIKARFGNKVWIAADTCLCAYTSHGHCGILDPTGEIVLNNESVIVLTDYALQLARAGADCIAPSDMMDGRIGAIRQLLDSNGFDDVCIMSYSAKFNSQFYGPFRDACKSQPNKENGLRDRKTYQISYFNAKDAILTALRDAEEGADIIMVKPAIPYLDVIKELSLTTQLTIAAYHVSGEYQSIELLAMHNGIDREKAHIEIWAALKRGGASIIISYAARHAKNWLERNQSV